MSDDRAMGCLLSRRDALRLLGGCAACLIAGSPVPVSAVRGPSLLRVENGQCHPLAGAQVDIWHCDAQGVYSDVKDPGFNTIGQKFLRGYQITDPRGDGRFLTIYPGWYGGRTVHIHVKIRTASPQTKQSFELTTQMYFEDALSDRVFADPPYAEKGARLGRNEDDRIFRRGGEQLLLSPTPTATGFSATFSVGLQFPST